MVGVRIEEEERPAVLNRRASMSDAAPWVLTLTAGVICYGLFFNRGLGLSVIGYSIAPAERVMQGEVPYRDFLFNYTPGVLWVNALLMKALGATLMTTRIGLLAFKLVTLLVLFGLARRLTSGRAALVPVALTLAWLGHQQIFNVYPDQYLLLFALAGLGCMLNYDETDKVRWLLLCGLATGGVFVFKYNVGVLLLGSGALAIVLRESMITRRISGAAKRVAVYVIGFAAAAAVLIAYLVYNHAFDAMITHFLHHAAEYSETRSTTLPPAGLVLPAALASLAAIMTGVIVRLQAAQFFQAYLIAVIAIGSVIILAPARAAGLGESAIAAVAYFPPLVFAAALGLGIWQLAKTERNSSSWWRDNGATTIVGLFAFAVYLEVFPRADFYHLVRVLPPVFLFFFALLVRGWPLLKRHLAGSISSPDRAALLVVSAPLVFLLLAGVQDSWAPQLDSGLHFIDNRELTIERARGIFVEERQAELTEGLVGLIENNSSPEDYIFSFAQRGSALYFLAARRNPTRFLWWRSVGISGEEREAVMTMIRNRRPKLIVIQDVAANKETQDFIGENYDHIGTVVDIAVYGLRKPNDAAGDKLTAN